jgi:PIN domain nuclease of toxin-antitoxin system
MKFLLDTHLLLWAASQPEKLSKQAQELIEHPDSELYFSAASLWEISIKQSLGRVDFDVNARILRRGLLDNGYSELSITGVHALAVEALPGLHKDPFDRMLLAQADSEGITLLTSDKVVGQYAGAVRLI